MLSANFGLLLKQALKLGHFPHLGAFNFFLSLFLFAETLKSSAASIPPAARDDDCYLGGKVFLPKPHLLLTFVLFDKG